MVEDTDKEDWTFEPNKWSRRGRGRCVSDEKRREEAVKGGERHEQRENNNNHELIFCCLTVVILLKFVIFILNPVLW